MGETMIHGKNIAFSYEGSAERCLNDVCIDVQPGEFAAILGSNGSGKSTLIKHFNALLPLQQGSLTVSGIRVGDNDQLWKLRRRAGMVFQNPDNQFVSTMVYEDVAFGLENYGVPAEEIPQRVAEALVAVGMDGFQERATHMLSGGQKQRVAIAGVLAVDPDILIFDEATSMLDPSGREEVLETIRRLHKERGKTLVMITHFVEEAEAADRVYLMCGGRILADGPPRTVLTDPALLRRTGLTPPLPVRLYHDLAARGIELGECPLTDEELADQICRLL